MSECPCPPVRAAACGRSPWQSRWAVWTLIHSCHKSVTQALDFVEHLELSETQMMIAERILKEIKNRLGFLQSVGLQYLTLSRGAGSCRRREPAHPPGHPERLLPDGGAVYPGRNPPSACTSGTTTCFSRP